jgi:hypothetical protein
MVNRKKQHLKPLALWRLNVPAKTMAAKFISMLDRSKK